jgi:hypothetical protein
VSAEDAPLVRLTGDGTLTGEEPLEAQLRIRRLLGSPRVEEVAPTAYLPVLPERGAHGTLLAATLCALPELGADLAPYGWRLGTGRGRDLARAEVLRRQDLDTAPVALHEAEHPGLLLPFLGPATVWARAFLPAGERVLADAGARREVAEALATGIVDQADRLRAQLPGLRVSVLLREDDAAAVAAGTLRTASALRRHDPVPVDEIGAVWRDLTEVLRAADLPLLLSVGGGADLLAAAGRARPQALGVDPTAATIGHGDGTAWWETVAGLHESGTPLVLRTDPSRPDLPVQRFLAGWTELGFAAGEARGTGLMAYRPDRSAPGGTRPPGVAPGPLSTADIDAVFEAAQRLAERIID